MKPAMILVARSQKRTEALAGNANNAHEKRELRLLLSCDNAVRNTQISNE